MSGNEWSIVEWGEAVILRGSTWSCSEVLGVELTKGGSIKGNFTRNDGAM